MKVFPFFLSPDAGSSGATAVAATIAPAPAAEATPSAAEVMAELSDFTPPSLDFLNPQADDKPQTDPEPKPDDKKKPEQKKPESQEQRKEPPAKQLREELERVKKEHADLKARFDDHPKVKELSEKLTEREQALKTREERLAEVERELSIRDPMASSKLTELQDGFNKEYSRGMEFVPELEGGYMDLMKRFAALPRGDRAAYATALAEFETEVEGIVGQRKFGPAMDIIRKGFDFTNDYKKAATELREGAGKMAFEGRTKQWTEHSKHVSERLASALEVPEDIAKSDPFNPVLFVSKSLAAMDETKRSEIEGKVDAFVRDIFAGRKPKSDADFPGLDKKQIAERLEAEGGWFKEATPMAIKHLKQGLLLMTVLRPFLKEFSSMSERLEKQAKATPPDPTRGGESKPGAEDEDDVANYSAPAIPRLR